MRVLYFARAREVAGVAEEEVQLEEEGVQLGAGAPSPAAAAAASTCSSEGLREQLARRHPGLASVLRTCVLAVNQEYVRQGERVALAQGDEVAVIPPLSGG